MGTKVAVLRHVKAREFVLQGAANLDELVGPGWIFLINLDDFAIHNGSMCVLGQTAKAVFEDTLIELPEYEDMVEVLNGTNGFVEDAIFEVSWQIRNGFLAASDWSLVATSDTMPNYTELQPAWEELIGARQYAARGAMLPKEIAEARRDALNELIALRNKSGYVERRVAEQNGL